MWRRIKQDPPNPSSAELFISFSRVFPGRVILQIRNDHETARVSLSRTQFRALANDLQPYATPERGSDREKLLNDPRFARTRERFATSNPPVYIPPPEADTVDR